jgi:hypothetical protein
MSVENEEKGSIRAYTPNSSFLRSAVEQDPHAASIAIRPMLRCHFIAVWRDPGHIFDAKLLVHSAGQKSPAAEHG